MVNEANPEEEHTPLRSHSVAQITAIIPTLNRPILLKEAIKSLLKQTLVPSEIIVVDDGSSIAVDAIALQREFGPTLRVLRNDKSLGLAYARNLGVAEASGHYVVHLDDDDLLAPETLVEAYTLLENEPDLKVVFLGVLGFGQNAAYFNRVQPNAVARVQRIASGLERSPSLVFFGAQLMKGLLHSVPSAFQHVMVSKETWSRVSMLRWRAYQLDSETPDIESAKRKITGQLRDSEWALYAAAICHKTVLLNAPRYLARCEGQGLSSTPANREKHLMQHLAIKEQLFKASGSIPELRAWAGEIRKRVASSHADAAYYFFLSKRRLIAWQYARRAVVLVPSWAHLRFALRMWLPVRKTNQMSL